jgi:cell division protein FtsB
VPDLWGIVAPIVVSVIISLVGAFFIARYAGPAQAAYVQALEGRLKVVTGERDDALREIPVLRARVVQLEAEVAQLKHDGIAKDAEVIDLYRRLDLDERRLKADERRVFADHKREKADEARVDQGLARHEKRDEG